LGRVKLVLLVEATQEDKPRDNTPMPDLLTSVPMVSVEKGKLSSCKGPTQIILSVKCPKVYMIY
jgi:hypothetical protein